MEMVVLNLEFYECIMLFSNLGIEKVKSDFDSDF